MGKRKMHPETYARKQAEMKEREKKAAHDDFLRTRREKQDALDGVQSSQGSLWEQYSQESRTSDAVRARREKAERERREAAEAERRAAAEAKENARVRKVLVCGDARGSLAKLFTMADAQEKKVGAFDAQLCVGAFFPRGEGAEALGADDIRYLSGEMRVSPACFFVDDNAALLHAAPHGKTYANGKLHFLGAYGVREIAGLRVAFLSGRYDASVYDTVDADFVGGAFTSRAVGELRRLALEDADHRGVDIFLTCGWPADLDREISDAGARPPEVVAPGGQQQQLSWRLASAPPFAELCRALEPRYHIFGFANLFYQRPAFKAPGRGHPCRCIGLGQVGSTSKQQKWLHALALSPMAHMKREDILQLPAVITACPFSAASAAAAAPEAAAAAAGGAAGAEDSTLPERALAALLGGDLASYEPLAASLRLRRLDLLVADASASSASGAGAAATSALATAGAGEASRSPGADDSEDDV
eukprot:TRINITY_DN12043_c0_g2_i1.p1 TRINITY_DN12043_c0_g2~~TRINITY_DN12043_c0_g2_i1.p1  ORF type:complete len:492 (+),score=108.33 TRINITY_DN12043_c0_g2_i1:51-1478(+)